ncbi:MAG TPA: MFS transporter [Rhizomicrobium sp.]|jgi:MHS family citrate/tricarballylate:H+ symporter-like MFS transporter|nr:MFS transporter [Rhizomicrobium sp.]
MAGDEQAADPKRLAVRNITAATVGNALEFYDFITYAFFAIQIGRCFFPNTNAYANLMLSLATFGAGFITRPIGGIIIGSYADRVGRRPAMILSFTLMGVAIIAMALIPSYARIGIAAPILAVLARMVQGFSLGGEVGPTTAYLLESAPLHRRGFVVAWQAASQAIAATLAGLVGLILASTLSASALTDYGWRIAFLLGAVTLPVGLWMRRGLPETLHEPEHHTVAPATKTASVYATFRQNARVIVLGLIVLASGTIGTYLFNYLTTFAQSTLKMTPTVAFAGTFAQNVISLFAVLFGGWLSDRIGRRPVMIYPRFLFLILLLPAFYWIVEARSATALIVGSAILSLLSSVGGGAFYAALTESLPKRIRGGAFATIYAFSIALFGGTTQLVVTWLIHVTGNPMAPAYYWLIAATIGTAAAMAIIESAPVRAISRPVLAE